MMINLSLSAGHPTATDVTLGRAAASTLAIILSAGATASADVVLSEPAPMVAMESSPSAEVSPPSEWALWTALATGTDIQAFEFWRAWYRALGEVYAAATGNCVFPRMMTPWADGTITGATETTIEDSNATAWVIAGGCSGTSRWVGYSCGGDNVHVPANYDVVIELSQTDPRLVIRKTITANTETVLTIGSLAIHKDVYKQFGAYGDLVGKKYRIIRTGDAASGYPSWHERWPFPMNQLKDQGSITASAAGSVTDSSKSWTDDEFVGFEIIYDASGLKRKTITGNTSDTITFSGSDAPTGTFDIIIAGSVYVPTSADYPMRWYAGIGENALSIYPDGTVAGSYHAAATVELYQGANAGLCDYDIVTALNRDIWTGFDDQCTPEKNLSPNYYKAVIPASQMFLEEHCIYFVERDMTPGAGAIPNLVAAKAFSLAGINSATTTDTSTAGSVEFSVSVPSEHTSIDIFYGVYNTSGDLITSGQTTTTGTVSLSVATPLYDGQTITFIYSYGWSRIVERAVRYVYARTYFKPDLDAFDAPIDPPNNVAGETGTWITRPPDTEYAEFSAQGYPTTYGVTFVDGHYVRYLAHAYHDGMIEDSAHTSAPEDIDYIVYAEELLPPVASLSAYEALKSGTASAGSETQLTDDSKSWYVGGVMRTESGTSTGGSTTTLSDSSKSGSALWDPATGRWVGFILSVEISTGVFEKRQITAHSGTTLTVGVAFSASASGKPYTIDEPDNVLNRWQGRKIIVTQGGSDYESIITGSDNTTLFFDDIGITVADGDAYRIEEMKPGETIRRVSGAWEPISNGEKKHPSKTTRYGRARNNDFLSPVVLQELRDFRNELKQRKQSISVHSREDDDIPENNQRFVGTGGSGPMYLDGDATQCEESKTLPDTYWNDPLEYTESESGGYPMAWSLMRMYSGLASGSSQMTLFRRYAYFSTIDGAACMARTVQMWGYCDAYGNTSLVPCATPPAVAVITETEFNDQGDGVAGLGFEQWFPIGGATVIPAGETESDRVRIGQAQSVKPEWGTCPTMMTTACNQVTSTMTSGWEMADGLAIIDYDMQYID